MKVTDSVLFRPLESMTVAEKVHSSITFVREAYDSTIFLRCCMFGIIMALATVGVGVGCGGWVGGGRLGGLCMMYICACASVGAYMRE